MVWLEIALTGVTALRLHPWRSLATIACVVAGLCPYLTGLSICEGLAQQSLVALEAGADLYVTGIQFGRTVPLPREAVDTIAKIPGVMRVEPRIIGKLALGVEHYEAVVVGMPPDVLEPSFIEGAMFRESGANELVVGRELAARLGLKVGSLLPPFYHNRRGDRVSKIVGVFSADAPLWQANLIFTSFKTASRLFDQPALTTDILVYCRAGADEELAKSIRRKLHWDLPDGSRLDAHASERDAVRGLWSAAAAHRDGVYHLHWMLAASIAILAVLVTSGFGGSERRHEVGVLKAIGWRTDEILVRGLVEGLLLTAAGASLAVLGTWFWLAVLNGVAIAPMFLPGLGWRPQVTVPFEMVPLPIVLATMLSWLIVTSGSLYTTWKTAMASPANALRSIA